jgi:hypothetical protein
MKPMKSSLKKLFKVIETDTTTPSLVVMHQGDLRSILIGGGWKEAEVDAYYKALGATHGEPIHLYGERKESAAVEGKVLPSPGRWLKAYRELHSKCARCCGSGIRKARCCGARACLRCKGTGKEPVA